MEYRPLRATPSQETLVSLLQLEPVPIADTEKDLPPLPEDAREDDDHDEPTTTERSIEPGLARTSSLGLSGSSHGSVYYLTRIQRYSTYALSIFTGIHLANTSLIPLATQSVPASESYLLLAREIYQTPLTEPLFVALPIAAHIASGIALRLVRRAQNLKRYGGATPAVLPQKSATTLSFGSSSSGGGRSSSSSWPPLSVISLSGYGFAALLAAHVAVNRLLPLHLDGDSSNIGLAYVAHGFARGGPVSYVAYAGLLATACGHMAWGWAKWVGLAPLARWRDDPASGGVLLGPGGTRNRAEEARRRRRRRRIWLWINGTAVVSGLLWAAGGLGVVAQGGRTEGWVGKIYDEMYAAIGH